MIGIGATQRTKGYCDLDNQLFPSTSQLHQERGEIGGDRGFPGALDSPGGSRKTGVDIMNAH